MGFPSEADKEAVRSAIRAGADITETDASNNNPLHLAAGFNYDPEIISAMIGMGADVSAKNVHGWTPLHVAAAFNSHIGVVKAMLDHGADREALTNGGDTPYDLAVRHQVPDSEEDESSLGFCRSNAPGASGDGRAVAWRAPRAPERGAGRFAVGCVNWGVDRAGRAA